jgi:hypothetical protein
MAEFRDDIGGWLPLETIRAAVDPGTVVRRRDTSGKVRYRSGVDVGGGVKDSFCAAVAHTENGVEVLDAVLEIMAPYDPHEATKRVADFLKGYGLHSTTGDRYSAEWSVNAFKAAGIRYDPSDRVRSEIYLDALPLFTSGRVRLLDNDRLVAQFAGLERRTSPGGRDVVDHGKRGHDDLCNAAAIALISAPRPMMIITDKLLERARIPTDRSNLWNNPY